jgi:transcriptional regulator with XRE-family HTH domain
MKDTYSLEEVEKLEKADADAIVERGIRTGSELRLVRKVAGLRANELASVLDVTPETVSRWEGGKQTIPRAIAFAVGEIYERPVITRRKLEKLAI